MELQRTSLIGDKIYLQPMDINFYDKQYLDWVNDDEIIDNMGTLFLPTTQEALQEYIKDNTNKDNIAFFAIRWKGNNEFIGTVKIGPIDWVHRKTYLGMLIGNKNFRGKGVGTEATRLILSFGFKRLNLHWIGAGVVSENNTARRSYNKAGLREICVIPNQLWFNGRYVDNVIMGITEEEYFRLTNPSK